MSHSCAVIIKARSFGTETVLQSTLAGYASEWKWNVSYPAEGYQLSKLASDRAWWVRRSSAHWMTFEHTVSMAACLVIPFHQSRGPPVAWLPLTTENIPIKSLIPFKPPSRRGSYPSFVSQDTSLCLHQYSLNF